MNWLYISIIGIMCLSATLFMSGLMIQLIYKEWLQNTLSMEAIIIFTLMLILFWGCFLGFLYKVYCDANTILTDKELIQPSIFVGTKMIKWQDVTDVRVFNNFGYHVFQGKAKIVVSPYAYKNPNKVIELLFKNIHNNNPNLTR